MSVRTLLYAGKGGTYDSSKSPDNSNSFETKSQDMKEQFKEQVAVVKEQARSYADLPRDSDEKINAVIKQVHNDIKELSTVTNFRNTNLDEFYNFESKWLSNKELEKMLTKSPFGSWGENANQYFYEVYNIRQKAVINANLSWNDWKKVLGRNWVQWNYTNWGKGVRAGESWDNLTTGVGETAGNIVGGTVSGISSGLGGKKILIIAGVGVVALVLFASSKRGGSVASNVGTATGGVKR